MRFEYSKVVGLVVVSVFVLLLWPGHFFGDGSDDLHDRLVIWKRVEAIAKKRGAMIERDFAKVVSNEELRKSLMLEAPSILLIQVELEELRKEWLDYAMSANGNGDFDEIIIELASYGSHNPFEKLEVLSRMESECSSFELRTYATVEILGIFLSMSDVEAASAKAEVINSALRTPSSLNHGWKNELSGRVNFYLISHEEDIPTSGPLFLLKEYVNSTTPHSPKDDLLEIWTIGSPD